MSKVVFQKFSSIGIEVVLPLCLLILLTYLYIDCAHFLTFADATTARRALLLANATDTKWTFTIAYRILGLINRGWVDNLFFLRCSGMALVALGALPFAVVSVRCLTEVPMKILTFVTLLLGGMGVYNYFPNSLPEYNHLAVFCVLGIGTTFVYLVHNQLKISLRFAFLLGALFGLFLTVNLPSSLITLLIFCGLWIIQGGPHIKWRSFHKDIVKGPAREAMSVIILSILNYGLLMLCFGEFDLGITNPGVKYNEVALKGLESFFLPIGNLLYVVLRTITFSIEVVVVTGILLLTFLVAKRVAFIHSFFRLLFFFLPLVWLWTSLWFTYQGFETYQIPSLWDFSPMFFLGKLIWYGYATTLPLLFLIVFYVGSCQSTELKRNDLILISFFCLVSFSACFGSGARVVHKMQMYQWGLLFGSLLFLEKVKESVVSKRQFILSLLILVSSQSSFHQILPLVRARTGGVFSEELQDLPRGKNLRVQKEFSDWIHSLFVITNQFGVEPNEVVLSNDYLAIYLLGLHQGVLPDSSHPRFVKNALVRFGLLQKERDPGKLGTRWENSWFLRILGPPDLPLAKLELATALEYYLEKNLFDIKDVVIRGNTSTSIVYERSRLN